MKRFEIQEKVLWKGKEYKIVTCQKDFSNNKIYYFLEGMEHRVPEGEIEMIVKKSKKVEFAKGLIEVEKEIEKEFIPVQEGKETFPQNEETTPLKRRKRKNK